MATVDQGPRMTMRSQSSTAMARHRQAMGSPTTQTAKRRTGPQAKAEVGSPAVSRPKAAPAVTHATPHPNLMLLRMGSF